MGKLDATTCSWCGTRRRSFESWRDHVALNECRHIPLAEQLSCVLAHADTWSEKAFERVVIRWFRLHGWLAFHDPRTTPSTEPGLPDWVLINPPHVLFIELKKQTGKASTDQVRVIKAIQRCDYVSGYFARPSDAGTLLALATKEL